METKTPKFDKLMDEIFEKLFPHVRVCKWKGMHEHCEGDFEITTEDIKFLKMLRVPSPNFCPTCRRLRRLPHMNHSRLFKRQCDVQGHNEVMISILPDECPFPVYDYKYFIGDEFNPFSYGVEYKKGESPMKTLLDFRKKFPMPSFLNRDTASVNSEYSNGGRETKNAYYAFGCYTSENVWYSGLVNRSRNIMDSRGVRDSEFVYEGTFSDHLYKSLFVYFSSNCTDSIFLFDCRNCSECFGCVNLRNKKNYIFNKQYSKEDYDSFLQSVFPLTLDKISNYENQFWSLVKSVPTNGPRNIAVTNVSGASSLNSKNLFDVIWMEYSENIRHADAGSHHKDSMDFIFSGGHSSMLYMTTNTGSQSSRTKFSVSSKYSVDCEFIFNSKNLDNCFMCFGLQNKSYCILNKQYEKEEYFKIVDEIKSEMLERGEYEDGLGLEFSAQAYNFSIGQIAYPLNEEKIIKLGGYVAKDPETNVGDTEIIKYEDLPTTIKEISDDIVNKAIVCKKSGRPFRVAISELEFYRKMNLPLPNVHPLLRIEKRLNFVKDGKKYRVICSKCKKNIETMLDPDEKFIFYCEDCYKREVY